MCKGYRKRSFIYLRFHASPFKSYPEILLSPTPKFPSLGSRTSVARPRNDISPPCCLQRASPESARGRGWGHPRSCSQRPAPCALPEQRPSEPARCAPEGTAVELPTAETWPRRRSRAATPAERPLGGPGELAQRRGVRAPAGRGGALLGQVCSLFARSAVGAKVQSPTSQGTASYKSQRSHCPW